MFVFWYDQVDKDGDGFHNFAQKLSSDVTRVLGSIAEGDDNSTTQLSASTSYSTSSSSSIPSSDDSIRTEMEEATEESFLYKPRLYSPIDLLETVTNPTTTRWDALDGLYKVHTWIIDATEEEIDVYSEEIKTWAIPELLQYIRTNVDDNQCVCEAVKLLRRLANHKDVNAIVFLEAHAINILVLALLSHNTNGFSPNQSCLFRTIWNFLMDIVLCPSVIVYFKKCDYHGQFQQKYYQRMKLVTAVNLCLDRAGHAMTFLWMAQIFDTLQMLLRTDDDDGNSKPNGDVRLLIWEKQIAQKCQQILDTNDYSYMFEYERVPIGAMTFFRSCLIDRDDDDLSESLDRHILTKFVRKTLAEFPMSGYIHGTGCQILNEISSSSSSIHSRTILMARDLTAEADEILQCTSSSKYNCKADYNDDYNDDYIDDYNDDYNDAPSKPEKKKDNNNKNYLLNLITSMFTKPCACGDDQTFEDQPFIL